MRVRLIPRNLKFDHDQIRGVGTTEARVGLTLLTNSEEHDYVYTQEDTTMHI
jgi:hypothetical protein